MSRGGELVKAPQVSPRMELIRIEIGRGVTGFFTSSPPRLIPLPMALEWAERHEEESRRTWPGSSLLDQVLDNMWRFLSQAFQKK